MPETIVTTSWDDGHVLDLRLAELLKKYHLGGTFYVAPQCREFSPQELLSDHQLRELARDFEIGAHTLTHLRLGRVSAQTADQEIKQSKAYLEKLLDRRIDSFCYPGGSYSFLNAQQVRNHGFRLARTIDRFAFDLGSDPFALPTSAHIYNHWSDVWPIARFARFHPLRFFAYFRHWDVLCKAMFDRTAKEGGVFHLWGHSWEIDRHRDWKKLEGVFAYISDRPGIKYLNNGQLL